MFYFFSYFLMLFFFGVFGFPDSKNRFYLEKCDQLNTVATKQNQPVCNRFWTVLIRGCRVRKRRFERVTEIADIRQSWNLTSSVCSFEDHSLDISTILSIVSHTSFYETHAVHYIMRRLYVLFCKAICTKKEKKSLILTRDWPKYLSQELPRDMNSVGIGIW